MRQLQISQRQRAARARRHSAAPPLLPLDPRDPDIVRAKQLQRQRRPRGGSRSDPVTRLPVTVLPHPGR